MSNLIAATRRTVNFIAAGGTGANILRGYSDNLPHNEHLLADERHVFIDTSLSNLVGVSSDKVYHIRKPDGTAMDGAGGNRAAVYAAVVAALPDIMSKFPVAEKNYFVTSLTGGSGPTITHAMIKHLHDLGHHAAILAVSSGESYKRIDNFIKTLTGYESVVAATKRPIVIALFENDESRTHEENNMAPQFAIAALSILSSGMNESLDSADVSNVFDYHTVTHFAPGIALMSITSDAEKLRDLPGPLAAYAAVARNRKETIPKLPAAYDTAGYMRGDEGSYDNSFYFGVSTTAATELFKDLIKQRDELERNKQVTQPVASLLGTNAGNAGEPVF